MRMAPPITPARHPAAGSRRKVGRGPDKRPPEMPDGRVEQFLAQAHACFRAPRGEHAAARFGIDLGTATIVLTAVDGAGCPVYWDFIRAGVVRDGVVVDFQGAVQAVQQLKSRAETILGMAVEEAATAHPPAVPSSDCRACHYVLQQAGVECRALVDEVSAANALLQIRDGAVVDVGGGSTGVGIFRDGKLSHLSDQPGGGHQLDLILAGALKLSIEDAEVMKREHGDGVAPLLRPGIERIAESIRRQCAGVCPGTLHLAGGALRLPQTDAVVSRYLDWPVQSYVHGELITPFGIAVI